jgi:peptidoglycan/xylan/chitin deacetylase (PgdA/CDA1 family)
MRYPILMYHQVDRPPPRGTPMRGLVVAPATFARHMAMLRLLGLRGVAMRELMPYLRGERSGRVVGVTFDDGYQNNLEQALPVLQEHGFTATCYAVSDRAGASNVWDQAQGVPSRPLMSDEQMRAWVKAGMEIGAHTRTHADLTEIDAETAHREIEGSRAELEQRLQTPVRHFCYPYGRFRPEHAQWTRDAGYESATTVNRGLRCAGC